MTIERIHGQTRGRCRAVVQRGLVYAVATDISTTSTVAEQTKRTLEALENNLDEAGSSKDRIILATVYLRGISKKAEMDAVWCDWIGASDNWPQSAYVASELAGDDQVEIVLIATET